MPGFHDWESFYVIVGAAAGALIGLQFVVMTLLADKPQLASPEAGAAFATPNVVHFGAVVLLAAFITTPRQTVGSLQVCLLASAVVGLGYASSVVARARRQTVYDPVLSDWVWHCALPIVAYACLLVAGLWLPSSPQTALYVVGGTALLLLFIGIHNAWDSAVWMTTKRE